MKKKILIIDDNRDFCEIISKYLSKQGYKVFMANDGMEGVSIVNMGKPDLIITDIVMPDMDGIDFFQKLEEHNNNIPVIVMSGDTLGKECLNSVCHWGAAGKLEKPFDMEELKVLVEKVFQK